MTGERSGYRVPNSSTATKTDTPLRDIPQSVQVIPQRVLEDRNVRELRDALETAGGVTSTGARSTSAFGENFQIRGFATRSSIFRDGIPSTSLGVLTTSDIESVEILKGPASVLFGQGEPGGVINLVSKKPLFEPYFSTSFTIEATKTLTGDTIQYSISREAFDKADADAVFVIVGNWDSKIKDVLSSLKSDKLWSTLKAVRQNKVYEVENHWVGSGPIAANAVIDDLFKYLVETP